MKYINLTALIFLGVTAFAQDVQFDYDRSANFSAYKTYQWVDRRPVPPGDQLLDQDIKRAVDEQLAGRGLRRVESDGDLQVSYQGAISQEKEFDYIRTGPGFGPGWGRRPDHQFDYRRGQACRRDIRCGEETTCLARLCI